MTTARGVAAEVRRRRRRVRELSGQLHTLPVWVRIPLLLALLAFLYSLPYLKIPVLNTPGSDFASVLFFPIGLYILCAVGLDLAIGRTGIVNFGFAGFFAVGAYCTGWFTTHGLNYYAVLPIAAVLGAVAALIMGLATLRLRGDYLAIVTLAFGLIVVQIIHNTPALGGINGITSIPHPPSVLGLDFGTFQAAPYDMLLFTIIVVVIFATTRLFESRLGRGWSAIRQDEDVAALMGVPTFRFKVIALVIGGVVGSIAGATYAAQAIYISPDSFDVTLSVVFVSAVVLGGAGNLVGVVVGAFVIGYLPERFRGFESLRILVFSAVLTLMMIARPQGLIPRRLAVSRRRRGPAQSTALAPTQEEGGTE